MIDGLRSGGARRTHYEAMLQSRAVTAADVEPALARDDAGLPTAFFDAAGIIRSDGDQRREIAALPDGPKRTSS